MRADRNCIHLDFDDFWLAGLLFVFTCKTCFCALEHNMKKLVLWSLPIVCCGLLAGVAFELKRRPATKFIYIDTGMENYAKWKGEVTTYDIDKDVICFVPSNGLPRKICLRYVSVSIGDPAIVEEAMSSE